jgi:hypothetical protein
MRPLPSVQSATHVSAGLAAWITPADGGAPWRFGAGDLVDLRGPSWEVPFMGGLGKPGRCQLTLSSSLGWIQANLPRLSRAQVALVLQANSDTFSPFVGRVRGVSLGGRDVNRLTLDLVDRFLDDNPLVPVEMLTDSYAMPHPEDLGLGYPLYYGAHLRPIYHVAVTSDLSVLLGPRNVSSANHVTSVWFNSDPELGIEPAGQQVLLMNKPWHQQSGSDNLVSGGRPFEVMDVGTRDVRLWRYQPASLNSGATVLAQNFGQLAAQPANTSTPLPSQDQVFVSFQPQVPSLVRRTYAAWGTLTFSPGTVTGSAELLLETLVASGLGYDNGEFFPLKFVSGPPYTATFSTHVDSPSALPTFHNVLGSSFTDVQVRARLKLAGTGAGSSSQMSVALNFSAELRPEAYRRFRVFSPVVNSTDVAVSGNPLAILDDLFRGQTGTPFRQDQSSAAQVLVQSYAFHCFLAERQALADLVDEFARTTAAYLWIGDSGMMQSRVYQESGKAAVDASITPDTLLDLQLLQNPLGTTAYEAEAASRFRVAFGYDFQLGRYLNAVQADRSTNALCASAAAAGVRGELQRETRHILSAEVASLYLGTLVRKHAQTQEYLELKLPARYFGVELADVLRVQHPALAGSEGLYQVTRVEPDYLGGTVAVTAARLLGARP